MEVRCRKARRTLEHWKLKEKEPGALPRGEVTNWPFCESIASGDS